MENNKTATSPKLTNDVEVLKCVLELLDKIVI